MNLRKFFSRKRETQQDDEYVQIKLNMPDLIRNMLYDAGINEVEEVMLSMGYPRQSHEVSEMSLQESDRRLGSVAPVMPAVRLLIRAFTEGIYTYVKEEVAEHHGDDVPPEAVDVLSRMKEMQHLSLVCAVLANLIDLGLVNVGEYYVVGTTTQTTPLNEN